MRPFTVVAQSTKLFVTALAFDECLYVFFGYRLFSSLLKGMAGRGRPRKCHENEQVDIIFFFLPQDIVDMLVEDKLDWQIEEGSALHTYLTPILVHLGEDPAAVVPLPLWGDGVPFTKKTSMFQVCWRKIKCMWQGFIMYSRPSGTFLCLNLSGLVGQTGKENGDVHLALPLCCWQEGHSKVSCDLLSHHICHSGLGALNPCSWSGVSQL